LQWCICGRSICKERGQGETVIAATAGRARRPPCAVLRLPSPPLNAQREHNDTQQQLKRRGAEWLAVMYLRAVDMRGDGTGLQWCICGRAICEERGRGETVIAATVGRARRPPCAVLRLPSPPLYAQRQHTDTQQRLTRRRAKWLAVVYRRAVDMRGEGTRGDRDSSDGEKSQKAPLRCSPSSLAPSLRTTTAHRYTTAVNAERGQVACGGVSAGRRYARRGDEGRH